MVRLALQHPRQTRTTDALLAGQGQVDTCIQQYVCDRTISRNMKAATTARQLHIEATIIRVHLRLGAEIFAMKALFRPTRRLCRSQDERHKAAWTANIQMVPFCIFRQDLPYIELLLITLIVEVEANSIGKVGILHTPNERCARWRAAAIVHLEVSADLRQTLSHAQDRCNSDATGEKQRALGAMRQREQVTGLADAQQATLSNQFMHALGSTPR